MHLFIAREALDPHLARLTPLLSGSVPVAGKLKALWSLIRYYAVWYPSLWVPRLRSNGDQNLNPVLKPHVAYVQKTSQRLARHVFHQMLRYQQRLESKQVILNRIVDIGTDLFVMVASCSYADALSTENQRTNNAIDLADLFCCEARKRIEDNFQANAHNHDRKRLKVAKRLLAADYEWLETDIIS